MSSAMPTQLAELIGRLEKALAGSPDRDELFQIDSCVKDVIEDLESVSRPVQGSDKTSGTSERPIYPLGDVKAEKARTALRDAAAMKSAAAQKNWQKALDSARRIQVTMS
jgi:hypothetical protein